MKLLLQIIGLLFLCVGCRQQPQRYQPVTLRMPQSNMEVFSASAIVGIRPTISSSPAAFEIHFQLSPEATGRFFRLPEGVRLVCVSPRGLVGETVVERKIGTGKDGYCFSVPFNNRSEFDAALQKLR